RVTGNDDNAVGSLESKAEHVLHITMTRRKGGHADAGVCIPTLGHLDHRVGVVITEDDPTRTLSVKSGLDFKQIPPRNNLAGECFASFFHKHLLGNRTISRDEMTKYQRFDSCGLSHFAGLLDAKRIP